MLLELLPSVTTKVVVGPRIEGNPRWMLDGSVVLIGPYHSSEEHEQHIGETVGSTDWLWSASDELRFDQKTLLLQSASFIVPDATLPLDLSLDVWQTASQDTGLIKLLDAKNFEVETTDFRWIAPHAQTLICVNEKAMKDSQQRLRLHIADNLELFFVDGRFCGWSLSNPMRFIVDAWEEPTVEDGDEQFVKILHDYFSLVTNPYIEQMEDRNPQLLNALNELYQRTTSDHSSSKQRSILQAAIADKLDRFYDQEVN